MNLKLQGKTAFVSGSTAGIGLAIASTLAAEGARVIINGRTKDRVDAAIAQIRKAHPTADLASFIGDLAQADAADRAAREHPRVDILINNMGIYEVRPFADITDADWMRLFEVNVLSGIRLSRLWFPGMLERDWGRIVFISSESAINIPTEMIHYGMTKTAQIAVARGLADLTKGTGVTVNSLLVGPTKSEGLEKFVADVAGAKGISPGQVEAAFFKEVRPASLLQRFETVQEIADVVAFLSSPLASGINGAAVRAEGGVIQSIT